jgi:hypothetical protein
MLTLYAGRKCDTGVQRYTLITAMQTEQSSPMNVIQWSTAAATSGFGQQAQVASEQQTLAQADSREGRCCSLNRKQYRRAEVAWGPSAGHVDKSVSSRVLQTCHHLNPADI